MTEGSNHQEMFTYHTTKPQNTWKWKLTDLKGQIDKSTLTVGDVNTLLSATQRTTEQKISKDTEEPTTNNQQGLTGTCRQPHQTEHTFFSKCPWTFTHRDGAWALKQTSTNLKESKSHKICKENEQNQKFVLCIDQQRLTLNWPRKKKNSNC